MKTIEEIRETFKKDRFAALLGMTVEEATEERVVCSVDIREDFANGMGEVQGGLIFTLADFAFAVAANLERIGTVTLDSTIRFVRAPKSGPLTATARNRHDGRSVQIYDVEVQDGGGRLVALATATGYRGTPAS